MVLTDDTKRLLAIVVKHFDEEDRVVREWQLRRCRRLKLYWNNFSQIYWSEGARDYRIMNADDAAYDSGDQSYYDRPVNVFRAFLETIIAALSIQIPAVSCAPDDADNPTDISTAKAGEKIAELIYKHNDVIFYWLHSLYIHCTEGMVACYTYEKEDKEYGEYEQKNYKDEEQQAYVCPHCKERIADEVMNQQQVLNFANENLASPEVQQQVPPELAQQVQSQVQKQPTPEQPPDIGLSLELENQFGPDDDDISLEDVLENEGPVCPACAAALDPALQKSKLIVPRFVGMNTQPKSRVCFDIKGTLYVKIANYAKTQKDTPYLIDSYETHYSNALHKYKGLRVDLPKGNWSNAGIGDPYEQAARLNPQYRNAFPEEQVTIKNCWLRPSSFEILNEEDCKALQKKFPAGAKVVMVNTVVADACNEALDDCWTLTRNPMHDYLNHDALGELLTNIQDITNDLISLTLQTIEHGIEQTWADPAVVNFDQQSQIEAAPGIITPTKLQGGAKNISESFFSTKAASLSPETFQFYQIINQLGQFVSGAMPSIFGGFQDAGSSRTAKEYTTARTASLQRLQTPWRMFTIWWKEIFGKAVPAYIKIVRKQGDERIVQKDDSGNYVNVIIRKADLGGKIGSIELENSETMPISDEQKAELVMRLMDLNNMEIMSALTSPENLPFIRKVVKMPEFKLPGEDDRQKQLEEIIELVNAEPITIPVNPMQAAISAQQGMEAQPTEMPSVEVDPLVDNHEIEAQICRSWLVSEAGRFAKLEKPLGYKNVLLHMKGHMEIQAQQMQQQAMMQSQQQPTDNKGQQNKTPPSGENTQEVNDGSTTVQ